MSPFRRRRWTWILDTHVAGYHHTVIFGGPNADGWEQVGLLSLALAGGAVIGVERELRGKAAGMRTQALIATGAALFMLISKFGFGDVVGAHVTLDPSRVAAQIVTGIGFIGGGLIFVQGSDVHGLTTAASVWISAAFGAACGADLVGPALVTLALYAIANGPLRMLEGRLRGSRR